MWFCRKASSRSWSCRQARRESQRSWAETCRRRTWKAATGKNRVQKTNNWWTRSEGYRHFLRGRISRGHQAQQHRLCFAFAEVKLSISTCVGAGTSGFWMQLPEKTSEFSETWSPSLRFSIVSSRSAFIFLADLKLISRTREYSTLFAELGSTKGHLSLAETCRRLDVLNRAQIHWLEFVQCILVERMAKKTLILLSFDNSNLWVKELVNWLEHRFRHGWILQVRSWVAKDYWILGQRWVWV